MYGSGTCKRVCARALHACTGCLCDLNLSIPLPRTCEQGKAVPVGNLQALVDRRSECGAALAKLTNSKIWVKPSCLPDYSCYSKQVAKWYEHLGKQANLLDNSCFWCTQHPSMVRDFCRISVVFYPTCEPR